MAVITGTGSADVIRAHAAGAYQLGQFTVFVSGRPADGIPPVVNLLINGQHVVLGIPVTASLVAGQVQQVSVPLPAGMTVESVAIQYPNDFVTSGGEDRNLIVHSVWLNGTELPVAAGTYQRTNVGDFPGTGSIYWEGILLFRGAAVQAAATPAPALREGNTILGQGGTDVAIYEGRATGYTIGRAGVEMGIASKSGTFAPDTLSAVERVLFDDRGTYGGGAQATVTADGGQRTIDGGMGLDTLVFLGARSNYTVTQSNGTFVVQHNGSEGRDVLTNVERLQFSDSNVALDISGHGGMAYRLYQAAFDRTPDRPGLGFQMNALDQGESILKVAANFIASPEFQQTYGALNNTQFATQLYQNVLGRAPDAQGLAFHVGNLDRGVSRAEVLVGFSESPENQAALIGTIQNGMVYTL